MITGDINPKLIHNNIITCKPSIPTKSNAFLYALLHVKLVAPPQSNNDACKFKRC